DGRRAPPMFRVLSRAQMRAFDKYAIENFHVPGIVLMENAGRGAADVISAMIEANHAPHATTARPAPPALPDDDEGPAPAAGATAPSLRIAAAAAEAARVRAFPV